MGAPPRQLTLETAPHERYTVRCQGWPVPVASKGMSQLPPTNVTKAHMQVLHQKHLQPSWWPSYPALLPPDVKLVAERKVLCTGSKVRPQVGGCSARQQEVLQCQVLRRALDPSAMDVASTALAIPVGCRHGV